MNERRLKIELDRWLAAEAGADADAAEAALSAVLATVPRSAPGPGFADRVMAALPAAAAPAASWLWGWRAATLAALVLGGLAAAFLPVLRWLPIPRPSLAALIKAAADGATDLAAWTATGLAAWGFLARVGQALGTAVATPEVASALFATAAVGAAALYTLHHLLMIERRPWS